MADAEFTRSARRPAPVVEDPLIQWATGLPTVNRQIYAGWMVEAGKQDDLDGAMQSAGFGLAGPASNDARAGKGGERAER